MSVYLVTWDFNKEGSNYNAKYSALVELLKNTTYVKDPGLDSVVFIDTTSSISDIFNYLGKVFDQNDRLFITKLQKGNFEGWMSKEINSWINSRA